MKQRHNILMVVPSLPADRSLVRLVARRGYVVAVNVGVEGLRRAVDQVRPRAVILDLEGIDPEQDAPGLCSALRGQEVIAITRERRAEMPDAIRCLRARGPVRHPSKREELLHWLPKDFGDAASDRPTRPDLPVVRH